MTWRVVHLRAEATTDEGWRKPTCSCGLRRCATCNEFYVPVKPDTCSKCKARDVSQPIPHGEPLWPEKWNCVELAPLKAADADTWAASYQGEPSIAGGYWFAGSPINTYETVRPGDFYIYMICDPSLRKTRKSDRTALPVVGTGPDQNFYLLDLILQRMDPEERMEHVFRLRRKWSQAPLRFRAFGYEEYGAASDSVAMRRESEVQNYRFPIIELGRSGEWHNLSTEARIATLIPQVKQGRWWFPNPDTPGRDPQLVAAVKDLLIEVERYPAVTFDDGLDALSRINDPAMSVQFPVVRPRPEPKDNFRGTSQGQHGWMGM